MDLEQFEKEQEEKQANKTTYTPGTGCYNHNHGRLLPSPCNAASLQDHYMQYGFAGLPDDWDGV